MRYFILILSLFCCQILFSQIDTINWTEMETSACLKFDKPNDMLNIHGYYDSLEKGNSRFEYKLTSNLLEVIWFQSPGTFGFQTSRIIYSYEFSKDTLTLSLSKKKNTDAALLELFGGNTIRYKKATSNDCE